MTFIIFTCNFHQVIGEDVMRFSKQRESILEIVKGTYSHPTADWIYAQARQVIPNISLGTIYRNLGQLVDRKEIRALDVGGAIHYDGQVHDHQHFLCVECDRVYDIDIKSGDVVSLIETKIDHHVTECQVHLTGTCSICKQN